MAGVLFLGSAQPYLQEALKLSSTVDAAIFSNFGEFVPAQHLAAKPAVHRVIRGIKPATVRIGRSLDRSAAGRSQVRIRRRLRYFAGVKK